MRCYARQVPKDAHCLLGLTMEDIGVFERVTFLFGLASFAQRVGVFSFCRQDPAWYRGKARMTDDLRMVFERATEREEGDEATVTRRALWTLSHEIGHTFGIRHCRFYHCTMAGSNGLEETDKRAARDLCPVCLRKLSWSTLTSNLRAVDTTIPPTSTVPWALERYRRLASFYSEFLKLFPGDDKVPEAQAFVLARIEHLESGAAWARLDPDLPRPPPPALGAAQGEAEPEPEPELEPGKDEAGEETGLARQCSSDAAELDAAEPRPEPEPEPEPEQEPELE